VLTPSPRATPWWRPAHAADVAQAQVFEAFLQAEIQELEQLTASAERHWLRRCERGIEADVRPPDALVRLRGRVAEVQKLLAALRSRFPQE
jgi:predicted secreted Zn-dependent protease